MAWVGTYDDIVNLREGQYRVRLLDAARTTGRPGLSGRGALARRNLRGHHLRRTRAGPRRTRWSASASSSTRSTRRPSGCPEQTDALRSGDDGYHTYRIPALASSPTRARCSPSAKAARTAAATRATSTCSSSARTDGGRTWCEQQVVWDDAANTCGNPCPVVDRKTGTIWLLMTRNRGDDHERQIIDQTSKDTRRVCVTHSADDGLTWAEPDGNHRRRRKQPDWTWYATGPGAGIQIERGPHAGGWSFPATTSRPGRKHYYSHVIYSRRPRQDLEAGRAARPQHQVNECEVVELADGRLMLNMRNYDRSEHHRARSAISDDGGRDVGRGQRHDPALIEPICQASIRRYSLARTTATRASSCSPTRPTSKQRVQHDRAPQPRRRRRRGPWPSVLHAGPSAYSCLAVLPDGEIACLYEGGESIPTSRSCWRGSRSSGFWTRGSRGDRRNDFTRQPGK